MLPDVPTVVSERVRNGILVVAVDDVKSLIRDDQVVTYIKNNERALSQVRGEIPFRWAIYGLPDELFGFPIEISGGIPARRLFRSQTSR